MDLNELILFGVRESVDRFFIAFGAYRLMLRMYKVVMKTLFRLRFLYLKLRVHLSNYATTLLYV